MTINNSVTDAAYHTVHDYPGGAPSLAPRIGIASARVLDNKVNPHSEHHKLTLAEADKLIGITGDLRILQALAAKNNYFLVSIPVGLTSDLCLLETYTDLVKKIGDFSGVFHDALADGVIEAGELDEMHATMHAFFSAGESLLQRAGELVE